MQVVMLGTGHGKSLNCYNYCFLLKENDSNLLVDCGGSIQIISQLRKNNIDVEDIDNIFISHSHMDHILGLIWIIRFLAPKYYNGLINKKLKIYGNEDVINKTLGLIELLIPNDFYIIINKKIDFIKLSNNQSFKILNSDMEVFDTRSDRGQQFGFKLVYNNINICYFGDDNFDLINERYMQNCDYAFMNARDINNEIVSSHSTVKFSAMIAQKYKVKNLILSHCNDNDLKNRKKLFTNEASKYFAGNIMVPNDLEVFEING